MVDCQIGEVSTQALWDTGAQVSLLSLSWLNKHVKDYKLNDLESVLGGKLEVEAVGGKRIPYEGYVQLDFKMGTSRLAVPFLVTKESLLHPLIGYNVIEMIAKSDVKSDGSSEFKDFQKGFTGITDEKMNALINFLKTEEPGELARVTTYKSGSLIRAGASISIPCRVENCQVEKRTPVIFEPTVDLSLDDALQIHESILTLKKGPTPRVFITVTNHTSRDIKIPGKTWLGDIHLVRSMTPVEITFKELKKSEDSTTEVKAGEGGVGSCLTKSTSDQTCELACCQKKDPQMKDGIPTIHFTDNSELKNSGESLHNCSDDVIRCDNCSSCSCSGEVHHAGHAGHIAHPVAEGEVCHTSCVGHAAHHVPV